LINDISRDIIIIVKKIIFMELCLIMVKKDGYNKKILLFKALVLFVFVVVGLMYSTIKTNNVYAKQIKENKKSDSEVTVGVGEKIKLDIAKDNKYDKYKFVIKNDKYAHVTSFGNIYGYKKGKTVVNCYKKRDYEKEGENAEILETVKVIVKPAPKKINVTTKKDYVFKGQKMKVKVAINNKYACSTYEYKSSDPSVCKVSKNGMLTARKKGDVKITVKAFNGVKKSIKVKIKDTDKLVALTFDDGPSDNTRRLLKEMDELDFHGTFFMVGTMIRGNGDILRTMKDNGNELAVHAWNHGNLANMSKSQVIADMKRTANLINEYTGVDVNLMRPPYGSYNATTIKALKAIDYSCIIWNINVEDYLTTDSNVVYNNILRCVHPGAVLVIHDSHSWSVDGVIKAMKQLKKQGYEFCTVSEFCKVKGLKLGGGEKIFGTTN